MLASFSWSTPRPPLPVCSPAIRTHIPNWLDLNKSKPKSPLRGLLKSRILQLGELDVTTPCWFHRSLNKQRDCATTNSPKIATPTPNSSPGSAGCSSAAQHRLPLPSHSPAQAHLGPGCECEPVDRILLEERAAYPIV